MYLYFYWQWHAFYKYVCTKFNLRRSFKRAKNTLSRIHASMAIKAQFWLFYWNYSATIGQKTFLLFFKSSKNIFKHWILKPNDNFSFNFMKEFQKSKHLHISHLWKENNQPVFVKHKQIKNQVLFYAALCFVICML